MQVMLATGNADKVRELEALLAGRQVTAAPAGFDPEETGTTLLQNALLAGLGTWVGGMYVVLREGLPFERSWARAAFFAFGVFGLSWT